MTPLTAERVRFIRAKRAASPPWTLVKIGAALGLDPSYVCKLKRRYIDEMNRPLMDRWLNVHDIRAMGERAVRETA